MIKQLLAKMFKRETAEETLKRVREEIKSEAVNNIKTNWHHQAGSRHESY